MLCFWLLIFVFNVCLGVPPSPTENLLRDVNIITSSIQQAINGIENWKSVYDTQIEPRIVSFSTSIATIDSNVKNLQERAHVWDTFQLHVSAWNDQLASADRKLDIISKAQENLFNLETKLNRVFDLEYKLDAITKNIESFEETLSEISRKTEQNYHDGDNLFNKFTTRGILSTLNLIEGKLDKMQLTNQIQPPRPLKTNEDFKPAKCSSPAVQELLNDISSKVDVIFDKFSAKYDPDVEEDEERSSEQHMNDENVEGLRHDSDINLFRKILRRINQPCQRTSDKLDIILSKIEAIENTTSAHHLHQEHFNQSAAQDVNASSVGELRKHKDASLNSFFVEQRSHFESILERYINNNCLQPSKFTQLLEAEHISRGEEHAEVEMSSCEDLPKNFTDGVYVFKKLKEDNNSARRNYNTRYCQTQNDKRWTVIQRRGDYQPAQNFNRPWDEYKTGFGNLRTDFWFGNDFIHRISADKDLILRVNLEDFDGNTTWAEYYPFYVSDEADNYRLSLGEYFGNASDSFSSHNQSMFSTYDRTNDNSPVCCPCAKSYGGGWWFNSCFEANLNGEYHGHPNTAKYFRGIIWEHWLGNYSLRKTVMMVRSRNDEDVMHAANPIETTTYEENMETTRTPRLIYLN